MRFMVDIYIPKEADDMDLYELMRVYAGWKIRRKYKYNGWDSYTTQSRYFDQGTPETELDQAMLFKKGWKAE